LRFAVAGYLLLLSVGGFLMPYGGHEGTAVSGFSLVLALGIVFLRTQKDFSVPRIGLLLMLAFLCIGFVQGLKPISDWQSTDTSQLNYCTNCQKAHPRMSDWSNSQRHQRDRVVP
jgi:hypothetical protein